MQIVNIVTGRKKIDGLTMLCIDIKVSRQQKVKENQNRNQLPRGRRIRGQGSVKTVTGKSNCNICCLVNQKISIQLIGNINFLRKKNIRKETMIVITNA